MNWAFVWFATKEPAYKSIRKGLWDEAMEYLKRTHDADGWRLLLLGA